jgi:glycosyltransferase involved in cell wall biosynthesis
LKIAYIGIKGFPSKWGADRVVEAVVRRLANRHDISVYCSRRDTSAAFVIPGVKLILLPYIPGKYFHMTSVDLFAAIHAVLFEGYDLIHLHHIEASFVLPLLKFKYKVITTSHGRITQGNKWGKIPSALMQAMEFPYSHLSDISTSVSQFDAIGLSKRYHKPVLYIPNGVEDALNLIHHDDGFKPGEGIQIQPKQFILFSAGRIIPLKGAHLLLEAYRQIQCNFPLLIVGDLTYDLSYAKLLKSLADERVKFIPFIESQAKLFNLIYQSFLYVFPSTNEGMSMSLLEAASTSTPILCSDIPANKTILQDNALYFSSGEITDLARKLEWAINYPEELQKFGIRARNWVRSNYSWDVIADNYEKLYKEVMHII